MIFWNNHWNLFSPEHHKKVIAINNNDIKNIAGIIQASLSCNTDNKNVMITGIEIEAKFAIADPFALSCVCCSANEIAVAAIRGVPTQKKPIGINRVGNEI